ncbi:MAG: TonB-dependent receptor, partial [Thiomonas sp.]
MVHSSQPIFFRTALAAAISLVGLNAQAQTAPADATALPPVVVSATGYPQPLADALPGVSVITREQIEQSGAQNLTTLLQQVAGVQVTSNGGPGQSGNVYVRGFGGPDVLVLLDGVPMNAQDATGVAYLNNFTTDQIRRIEIIRGNVSAIYGSGAIGGVVLITTRAGSKKPQASISVTAGSRNTATVSANASGQVGNTALQAGVSRYTTQGVSAINPAQLSNANPNSNGYGNATMNGSIVQTLAP